MTGVKRVNIYPAYTCDHTSEAIYDFFQRLATHYDATLDTGHIARAAADCTLNQDKFAKPFEQDALYVMAAAKLDKPLAVTAGFRQAIQAGQCGVIGEALICRASGAPQAWSGPLALKTVAQTLPKLSHWDGAALPTLIGNAEGKSLISDKAGYLSFGPYVNLLPGTYRVRIHYQGDAPVDKQLGSWDAIHTSPQGVVSEATAGAIMGSANEVATIDGIITVPRGYSGPWEIRTRVLGVGRVRLLGLDLDQQ